MKHINIGGRKFFYQNGGVEWRDDQPAVVFIHGAGMDHSVWQQQSRALAHQGWNVAALDLPGHGQSDDIGGLSAMGKYMDWLRDFLAAAKLPRAVLVGHSLGSGMAMEMAVQHPGLVGGMVLVGAGLEMKVHPDLLRDTRHDTPRAGDFISAYTHGKPSHMGGAATPGHWMLGSGTALLATCPGEVLHRDFQVCHEWNGSPLAAKVGCPVLVVTGARDRMTPPRLVRAVADAIPGARFELFDGVGHMVQIEAPRRFLGLLREFLASLP